MLNKSSAALLLLTASACNTLFAEDFSGANDSTTTSSGMAGTSTTSFDPTSLGPSSTSTPQETDADSTASDTTSSSTTSGSSTMSGSSTTEHTDATTDSETTTGASTSDSGTGEGTSGDGTPHRFIFVTNEKWRGYDLGGLAGADDKCTKAANDADLHNFNDSEYRAWLSVNSDLFDKSEDAKDRVPPSNATYILAGANTIIANGSSELTSGTLASPISVTETGVSLQDPVPVWTGTNAKGIHRVEDCSRWTDINIPLMPLGQVGTTIEKNWHWTNKESIFCLEQAHLYCIEID